MTLFQLLTLLVTTLSYVGVTIAFIYILFVGSEKEIQADRRKNRGVK